MIWATGCDIWGNDMPNQPIQVKSANECRSTCNTTKECTHFTWNNDYGKGDCWLKNGTVSKSDVKQFASPTVICGLVITTTIKTGKN